MKLRKSRLHRHGRIEIIPMIDVMFFLLATFMRASLSMQHLTSLPIHLPQGHAQQTPVHRPLTLAISAQGQLALNDQPTTLDTLAGQLRPLLSGNDGNLTIAADKQAAHGVVVQAMLRARSAGVAHFLIAVQHD